MTFICVGNDVGNVEGFDEGTEDDDGLEDFDGFDDGNDEGNVEGFEEGTEDDDGIDDESGDGFDDGIFDTDGDIETHESPMIAVSVLPYSPPLFINMSS